MEGVNEDAPPRAFAIVPRPAALLDVGKSDGNGLRQDEVLAEVARRAVGITPETACAIVLNKRSYSALLIDLLPLVLRTMT